MWETETQTRGQETETMNNSWWVHEDRTGWWWSVVGGAEVLTDGAGAGER